LNLNLTQYKSINKMSGVPVAFFQINGPHGPLTFLKDTNEVTFEAPNVRSLKNVVRNMPIDEICLNIVRKPYVLSKLNAATTVGVLYVQTGTTRTTRSARIITEPRGFVLCYDDEEGLFIDVICSTKGYGSFMMDVLLAYYADRNPDHAVTLHSLPSVLTYYPQFGFAFRQSCMEPSIDVPDYLLQPISERRFVPKGLAEAYGDEDFLQLMQFLQMNDLNVKKQGCGPNDSVTGNDCAEDGYVMKVCPMSMDLSTPRGGSSSTKARKKSKKLKRK